MTEIKIRLAKDGVFEIDHEIAGIVPMASEKDQIALTDDIERNEQRDPITLWRGKVVDGRCRMKSLSLLGKHIMYKELDSSLTKEEIRIFVKSVNTRRNLTVTQKAMSAAKGKISGIDKGSNAAISKSWGISEGLFKNALYICRKEKDIAEDLFNGKSVTIVDSKGRETTSSKISSVYAYLRRLEENVPTVCREYGFDANSFISTQAGKDWYFEEIKKIKDRGLKLDESMCRDYGELANFKFVEGE